MYNTFHYSSILFRYAIDIHFSFWRVNLILPLFQMTISYLIPIRIAYIVGTAYFKLQKIKEEICLVCSTPYIVKASISKKILFSFFEFDFIFSKIHSFYHHAKQIIQEVRSFSSKKCSLHFTMQKKISKGCRSLYSFCQPQSPCECDSEKSKSW